MNGFLRTSRIAIGLAALSALAPAKTLAAIESRSENLAREAELEQRRVRIDAHRRRLIADLRLQAGERLSAQREIARLVRDRLRVAASLSPGSGGS